MIVPQRRIARFTLFVLLADHAKRRNLSRLAFIYRDRLTRYFRITMQFVKGYEPFDK